MLTESHPTRQARTPEGKLRQRVWRLSRELGLCEEAYRNTLAALTGIRYARNLNETQLEYVVDVLEQLRAAKSCTARTVEYVSDAEALDVLGAAA
jgi:hypothetical protein